MREDLHAWKPSDCLFHVILGALTRACLAFDSGFRWDWDDDKLVRKCCSCAEKRLDYHFAEAVLSPDIASHERRIETPNSYVKMPLNFG